MFNCLSLRGNSNRARLSFRKSVSFQRNATHCIETDVYADCAMQINTDNRLCKSVSVCGYLWFDTDGREQLPFIKEQI